ncbi:hypothetical protein IWX90DRAFT_249723 [Phyllosticta citrichinensis]|uniref:Uncharacterized protein n=1 Tax=Phyllosticta citrichinensis TaxID=1130410 RepID=A0ABR1XQZ6_9PEZI
MTMAVQPLVTLASGCRQLHPLSLSLSLSLSPSLIFFLTLPALPSLNSPWPDRMHPKKKKKKTTHAFKKHRIQPDPHSLPARLHHVAVNSCVSSRPRFRLLSPPETVEQTTPSWEDLPSTTLRGPCSQPLPVTARHWPSACFHSTRSALRLPSLSDPSPADQETRLFSTAREQPIRTPVIGLHIHHTPLLHPPPPPSPSPCRSRLNHRIREKHVSPCHDSVDVFLFDRNPSCPHTVLFPTLRPVKTSAAARVVVQSTNSAADLPPYASTFRTWNITTRRQCDDAHQRIHSATVPGMIIITWSPTRSPTCLILHSSVAAQPFLTPSQRVPHSCPSDQSRPAGSRLS